VCALALLALSCVVRAQEGRKVESLGTPCRAFQALAGRMVTDRQTGKEWFVLTNMNEMSGAELIFIDPAANTGRSIRAPKGAGSWALKEVAGDRLVVGTFYDGQFMVFDLRQMQFVRSIRFPGEEYIWNLTLGGDGRLYGGTYPGGKLGALNLDTYTVEDCGAPAPPNLYLRYVSPTPDGRILCSFGTEKPTTRLYDPVARRFEAVPETLEGVTMGMVWQKYLLAGSSVFQGREFTRVPPPFPTPPAERGGWSVDLYLTTDEALFLRQGNALYRYRIGEKALTLIADMDLRGGWCLASNRKGEVFGVRGQDYFHLKPGDKTLKLRPIPVEIAPRPTLFLKADAKGRIWGGPSFGQTLFWMDTRTKKTVNTGGVCDAGGEVYDVTFLNGKTYAASYAGGDITEYDPTKPWDQWNLKNPRPVAKVGPDYIRPTGGIVTGPDGRLYSGWMAQYGRYGGAVAITHPGTGKTDLIANPLGEQAVEGVAVDGNRLYVGTSLSANGLPEKKGESAKFGILDLATRQPIFTHRFEGANSVRALAHDTKTGRVAMAVNGALRLFDVETRSFIAAAERAPRVSSRVIVAPGDGKAYYGSGKVVIAVDLQSGEAMTTAELPSNLSTLAVAPDGTLYAACGAEVFRITR
jgi:outer membrane protein assembly factor BamB